MTSLPISNPNDAKVLPVRSVGFKTLVAVFVSFLFPWALSVARKIFPLNFLLFYHFFLKKYLMRGIAPDPSGQKFREDPVSCQPLAKAIGKQQHENRLEEIPDKTCNKIPRREESIYY